VMLLKIVNEFIAEGVKPSSKYANRLFVNNYQLSLESSKLDADERILNCATTRMLCDISENKT